MKWRLVYGGPGPEDVRLEVEVEADELIVNSGVLLFYRATPEHQTPSGLRIPGGAKQLVRAYHAPVFSLVVLE